MRQWIRDQNIKLFRAALLAVPPSDQRATIEALLADELANNDGEQHAIAAARPEGAAPIKPAIKHKIREGFLQPSPLGEENQ